MTTITVPRELIEEGLKRVLLAIEEPRNTMSDGKALREIVRQLKLAEKSLTAALAQQAEPSKFPRAMFEYVEGDNMEEWRKNLSPEFWAMGDARIAWVNEGDAVMAQMKHQMEKESSNG